MNNVCVLDNGGDILWECQVRCTQEGLSALFDSMAPARVAIEASTHSPWVSRLLSELGHEVLVGNPRKLRMIYRNARKCDAHDAQMLARICRMDPALLCPIQHRGRQAQVDMTVLKSRNALVETRTRLVNHVRSLVKSVGERLPSCQAEAFHRKMGAFIPEDLKSALLPMLEILKKVTEKILAYDKAIAELSVQRYPECEVLQSIQGIGPITSLAYVLTIEDPTRFEKSRDVGAYLGLVPRLDQSGNMDPQLRITKTGCAYLRRLLVSAAQYILGPFAQDSKLRKWGLELCARGGKNGKKRAVVAVARKLCVLMHRLWMDGTFWEPFPEQCKEGVT
jgi:transposase